MMKLLGALSILFATVTALPAFASDICEAVALQDVPAMENPSSILKRGEHDTAITQYRVDKKTGIASFCSHGGYCYPTQVVANGAKVETLRLTNCKIGKKVTDDSDYVYYAVDVLRSKVSGQELRRDDVDNQLLKLGLCSACAGNAANNYVYKPASQCAKLVKRALKGAPNAVKELKDFPDYCN